MSSVRFGVVGVGALGRHHARILSEMPGVELVAVADSHAERGREVAAKHSARWVADYRQMLPDVDAVSIVVPTVAHLSVAADFLRAGIPVMIEKPLAHCVDAARAIVDLADRHRTLLQVGHIERFNPAWQTALSWCSSPKYIRMERTSGFTYRSTDIGVVHDLMIHDLDLVLSLNRCPIRHVEAFGVTVMGQHEDAAQARLHFANGCIADLVASRISPTVQRSAQIWTASGCVNIDLQQRTVQRYAPSVSLMFGDSPIEQARRPDANLEALKADVFGKLIEVQDLPVPSGDALTAELTAFLACVQSGRAPIVDGVQALAAMEAADQVLTSIANHQWEGTPTGAVGANVVRHASARRRAA
ncbi:gfo/Idh/MocA family oxidoreductase [bacterium]|nr:gfo/Idh/MocA family oxidoreductase [bacterium]